MQNTLLVFLIFLISLMSNCRIRIEPLTDAADDDVTVEMEENDIDLLPLAFIMGPTSDADGRIVIGKTDEWESFGKYLIINPNDIDLTLESVILAQVDPNGDAADFKTVGIKHGPAVLGMDVLAMDTQSVWLTFGAPLIIPAHSSKMVVEMVGKMAVVESIGACPSTHRCARSGHTPALSIIKANVKEGPISADFINHHPPRVLHKSRPIMEFLPIEEALHDGLNTIARVRIFTDPKHVITFRQLSLQLHASPELAVDVSDIKPWKANGVETVNGDCIGVFPPSGLAQYCLKDSEQYIFGTQDDGYLLELRVNVNGVVSGSSIKTELFAYANDKGHPRFSLVGIDHGPEVGVLVGFDVDSPQTSLRSSALLWSDISQDHTPLFPTSFDVLGRTFVQGANGFSIVTAP